MIFVCTEEFCSTAAESEELVKICPNCGKKMKEITPEGKFLREVPDSCAVFAPGEIKTFSVE